jgi:Papain family cysteine protease
MPIRMVDDNNDNYSNENENTGSGGGGGGGIGGLLFQFLPMIIGFLIKKPILLVAVLAIGAMMFFKGGCSSLLNNNSLSTGGKLDPAEYAKAQVYEALDETKNNLPEYISLLQYAPDRKNQGQQGSCVAWSSGYAARSILQSVSTKENPNNIAFSPAFLYNQIGLEGCQGSYIIRAMENLTNVGAVPFNAFPYTDKDCSRQPDSKLKNDAEQFKMQGFTRLSGNEGTDKIDIHAIKEHLSKDVPVVIGMMVGGSFMQPMMGKEIWHPNEDDYSQTGFGGHAMCIIGYDDRKEGGAFQIMNSWGSDWGENGIGWILYKDCKHFVREAYGLNPMPKMGNAIAQNLSCNFGLVTEQKNYIPLKYAGSNVFITSNPIAKMSKFKIEVKNNNPCYVYVVGKETDGSSYVLFPYPSPSNPQQTQFSPYCGITGTRLFPRGKIMQADAIGDKDFMAIITSIAPLNIFEINNTINLNKAQGFETAVNLAVKRQNNSNVTFGPTGDGNITFSTPQGDKDPVAMVIAIDKK